jgi:putative acetyltransferase
VNFRQHTPGDTRAIEDLFRTTFTDSEGEAEGQLIGDLARSLFERTPPGDLLNFVAEEDGRIVGSIFFTRLDFDSGVDAFILAPVAVSTAAQGKGVGQALITHGLDDLRSRGSGFALTYGDPDYYGRVGFRPIRDDVVRPPFPLSQPVGWLGQALQSDSIDALAGSLQCVEALSDPVYW